MNKNNLQAINFIPVDFDAIYESITNRPDRKSNPVPTRPDEEETNPEKENPKRKKKTRAYEVTC